MEERKEVNSSYATASGMSGNRGTPIVIPSVFGSSIIGKNVKTNIANRRMLFGRIKKLRG
jgi:hypothetical protein